MSGLSLATFAYPISNVIVPQGGPKTVPAILDFSATGQIDVDGQAVIDSHGIEYIQGVYIDNSDNAVAFTLLCNGTQHRIVCGPNSQGFFPLLSQLPPKFTATMAQAIGRKVPCQFYNVPIMTSVWKTI
jgi:hypothetical protein